MFDLPAVPLQPAEFKPAVSASKESYTLWMDVTAYCAKFQRQVPTVQPAGNEITVAARHKLYADAFNESVLMRPGQWLSRALVYLDNRGVDGAVNGLGASVGGSSSRLKRLQTGFVRTYALSMLAGSVAVVAVLLAVRFQ